MAPAAVRVLPCLLLATLALPALADPGASATMEQLLNTEVQGASGFAQPLSEAPSAVTVISADDIRRYGLRTVGEALDTVRGVYTTNERDYTYLGIRGFARPGDYNTRMLMMTDGVRRNDPLYDDAMVGNEMPIEMDWVKRLEFVPGPSSALYGPNAIFGVANAVLWSGGDINGSRVRVDAGSDHMARVSVLSGQRTDAGSDWLLGLSAYRRSGQDIYFSQFDSPDTNNGIAQGGLDGEQYLKAIAKFSHGNWRADAGYAYRRKNVPTAYYGTTFNEPGDFVTDRYVYADVAYSADFAANWNASARVRAGNYEFVGQYVYPDLLNRDNGQATWLGLDYLLTYTGLREHKLLIGGESQRDPQLNQSNFDLTPFASHLNDHRSMSTSGVFVQDEWRLNPTWIANLGVRTDRIDTFGMVSPRAALIHQLAPAATLKLIYGRAFRPPNVYERYYNDGNVTQKVNPDLKPERIATSEAVVDYAVTPLLRLSASYYHYRIDDLIDQVTDPADGLLTFINRPAIHAHGVELEAEAMLPAGIHAKGSISRQEVEESFGAVVNSPELLGKLLVDGPLFSTGWTIGLNLQAIDRRTTLTGEVPGYGVSNLVLTDKGTPAYGRWSVGIYNLANHRYLDPASAPVTGNTVPIDGRQVRIGWELAY
jgi:outer membrane receptor protein involved in Fe transport